jgi:prepilin-type N-terminal cleavage/methylation domain-containing protein
MKRGWTRGFTLVEILVVIGIIALLIAILLPALQKARDAGYRAVCGSNLHQIGVAMLIYAQETQGAFPRTYWYQDLVYNAGSPSSPGGDHTYQGLRGFTDPIATDPFANPTDPTGDNAFPPWVATKRPGDNDVTAAMFLLIRTQRLSPAVFVCPGRGIFYPDNLGGQPANMRSNFSSPFNLAYSISLPYPVDQQRVNSLNYQWGTKCKPGFALMADLNPGESFTGPYGQSCVVTVSGFYGGTGPQTPFDPMQLQRRANSNNHRKAGQNVLYADGSVVWNQTVFAGYQRDNIYTMSGTNSVTAMTGTYNIYTSATQYYVPNFTCGTDSMMFPDDGAMTIGYGIGIE